MTRTPHNSGLVQASSYDPATRVCHVELLHKGTYEYHDVDPQDHADMVAAKSVGSHFATVFKGQHGHKAKKLEGK